MCAKINVQTSSFHDASSSQGACRPNHSEHVQMPQEREPGQRLRGKQGFPYSQALLQSWAAGLIPKLTLPTPSHSSLSRSWLLNMGRARLPIDAHTGFDTGVAVPQHHMNITTTAWAGSRNSHPKDNVSGSPKKQRQGRESGAPAGEMVTDTPSFHA